VGSHSQAYEYHWHHGHIENVASGIIVRGVKCKVSDVEVGGDVSANAPTPHWRLLEFGTEKMQADPFMRQALESNVSTATSEFVGQYKRSIDRAIKKAQKVTA